MAKTTASLIDSLSQDGRWHEENAEALRKRPGAAKQLRAALLKHRSADVREGCAELLGEFGNTAAVPALITALGDEAEHVRYDALLALGKVLRIDLGWWLNVEAHQVTPRELHTVVSKWWKRNRHYVWW